MKQIYKIWLWLTVTRRCAWHKTHAGRFIHEAWLHCRYTDGICSCCYREVRIKMVKVMCAELTEPETPFIVKSL